MRITMEQLVETLGILPVVRTNEVNVRCPNCGRDKLNINFRKQLFACPACDIGGGVMDAWALFRGIETGSKPENRRRAKYDLEQYFGSTEQPKIKKEYKTPEIKETPIASPKVLDRAYRQLFKVSKLFSKHFWQLKKRGLTTNQIKKGMYVSSMEFTSEEIESHFAGIDLEGVPGFYQKDGKWELVFYGQGILVPVFSADGYIVAIQIRRDKGENKYLYISSVKEGGTKARTYPSFVNRNDKPMDTIILTEGPLKGSIINFLTDYPVIAIPGVNAQKFLVEELKNLKEKGLKKVIICYDMDYMTNPSVQRGLLKLRKRLSDLEIQFLQRRWNPEYKGYDDYLASKL